MSVVRGKGPGVGLRSFAEPLKGSKTGSWGLRFLCEHILAEGQIDLDPDYQRGRVWTRAQQEAFMGHVLEGGSVPDLWMRVLHHDRLPVEYECVDGKQRITAMKAWWDGEIPARLSDENGGREIWIGDLDAVELRQVHMDLCKPRVQFLEGYTRKQILRVYLRLNRGGTPHADSEIERVRALYEAER